MVSKVAVTVTVTVAVRSSDFEIDITAAKKLKNVTHFV